MQDKMQDEDGNIWQVDAQGNPVRLVQAAPSPTGGRVFTLPSSPKDAMAARREATQLAEANARLQEAPLDQELKRQQIENSRNPRSAPPSGYRFTAKGDLEPIPGGPVVGPNGVKKGTGALDAIVTQINDVARQFADGPGATTGLAGLWDYAPTGANKAFDAAAAGLEDQAAMAFRVPGSGTTSDADAARIAAANKPNRWDMDEANVQRLKQLRVRVDAAREAAGLPPADWELPGASEGSTGPRGETLLRSDEQVQFGGDGAPITGYRLKPEQEAQINDAVRHGDEGQAVALLQRFSGYPATDETKKSVQRSVAAARANPNARINFSYGGVDAAAQNQADLKRYGGQLPQAMQERAAAPGIDVSVRGGVNGLTAGLADYASAAGGTLGGGGFLKNLQRQQALSEADARLHPTNSLLSNIVGGAAGAALTEGAALRLLPARAAAWAPRLGDAAYGAVAGATGSARGEEGSGALTGLFAGSLGGMAGRAATRGVGGAFRGVRDASVDFLRDRRVPVTVGQVVGQGGAIGRMGKSIEDALSSVPILGDAVNARRLEGFEGFNRAAFNEGLAPVNANTGGAIGPEGVAAAQGARSQAYRDVLDPVQLSVDQAFDADNLTALNAGARLPTDMAARASYAIDRARENVDPNGVLSGTGFQQAMRRLRRTTSENAPLPNGHDLGEVMGTAEGAYTDLLNRQAPGVMGDYLAANAANRNVSVLKDAVNRARNGTRTGETGIFAPSQLNDAAAANARRFGDSAGTPAQPFYELGRAGQRVLPSSIPDSGTARRVATMAMPGVLGGTAGAGVGYAGGDPSSGAQAGLGLGATMALLGTRGGQRLLTALLADRPDALVSIGEQINRRAAIGGALGVPLLAGTGGQ